MGAWTLEAAAVGAFLVTAIAILLLRRVALHVDLVDRPGGRKRHHGAVPLVGGLGMAVGLAFGLTACGAAFGPLQLYLYSAMLLAIIGALDDSFGLSPTLRLVAQLAAVMPVFYAGGVRVLTLGDLVGVGPLDVSGAAFLVTAVVTIAAINAFNLLDGVDGLAGSVALTTLAVVFALQPDAVDPAVAALAPVLAACVGGFLLFNLPVPWDNRAYRCFMGDAGSTVLGFSLAWLTIRSSQQLHPLMEPVTALWLLIVPAVDLVWAVLRRLARRQSILRADGEHLHHQLARAGLRAPGIVGVLAGLSLLGGVTGVHLERAGAPAWASFELWGLAGAALVLSIELGVRFKRVARA